MFRSDPIPINIFQGKKRGYTSVHSVYKAHFIQKFMQKLNESFWMRSVPTEGDRGQQDDLENSWKSLRPKTVEIKKHLAEGGDGTPQMRRQYNFGIQYNQAARGARRKTLGTLTPDERALYERIYSTILRRTPKIGKTDATLRAFAKKEAWKKFLEKVRAQRSNLRIPIMIRTGRLVAATAPGTILHNRYYPPTSDQIISFEGNNISIDLSSIEYAEAADSKRPIIPVNCDPWLNEAHNYALQFAIEEYNRIKDGKKSAKQIAKTNEKRRINRFLRDEDVPF